MAGIGRVEAESESGGGVEEVLEKTEDAPPPEKMKGEMEGPAKSGPPAESVRFAWHCARSNFENVHEQARAALHQ